MMLYNVPFRSDSTGLQDLKLQDLHFCAHNERQDSALFGWYKPNYILPNLDLRSGIQLGLPKLLSQRKIWIQDFIVHDVSIPGMIHEGKDVSSM